MNLSKLNGLYNPMYEKRKTITDKEIVNKEHSKVYATARWQRMRVHQLQTVPLCTMCTMDNKVVQATTVDHCITFVDINDPYAFDSLNLFSLCHHHHAIVTIRERFMKNTWKLSVLSGVSIECIAKDKYCINITNVDIDGYYK